jgi:hypothetical protein
MGKTRRAKLHAGTPASRSPAPIRTPRSARLPDGPSIGILILSGGLSLILLLGMMLLDQALKTPAAPSGIISLELAGSLAAAQRILDSWQASARIQAGISLGLDFFFLSAYAFTLSGASRKVAARLSMFCLWCKFWGEILAKAAWLAGGLDAVENLALIRVLIGSGDAWQPVLAAGCAWLKFGLAAIILSYIGLGGVVILLQRWRVRKAR